MESNEKIPATENRRLQVYVDDEDAFSKVLTVPEGDYECVRVNQSWQDKGLVEGDIVLIRLGEENARAGDIVLLEEEGISRLGLMAEPGWLETPYGARPLNATEKIAGVGLALARRLHKD